MAQSPKQEVSSSRKEHGDEDSTLLPRPSPLPHPQKGQVGDKVAATFSCSMSKVCFLIKFILLRLILCNEKVQSVGFECFVPQIKAKLHAIYLTNPLAATHP